MKRNCMAYAPKIMFRHTNGLYAASGYEGWKYYKIKLVKEAP